MNALIEFLKTNYIYFAFGGVILVLALIGYIVDSSKNSKQKAEKESKEEEFVLDIPEMKNAKISDTINKNSGIEQNTQNEIPDLKLSPKE